MEEGDRVSVVFEFSLYSSRGFDLVDFAVDSLCSDIGLLMAERIAHAQ